MMRRRAAIIIGVTLLVLLIAGCASTPDPSAEVARLVGQHRQLDAAWQALWTDAFSDASSMFQSVVADDPSCAEAYRGLGLATFAMGTYADARSAFVTAIDSDPTSPFAVPVRDFLTTKLPRDQETYSAIRSVSELLAAQTAIPWIEREGRGVEQWYSTWIAPDLVAVAQQNAALGVVMGWQIVGPFPNISRSGLDHAWIDETSSSPVSSSKKYRGLNDWDVSWITPGYASTDGKVSLSGYLGGYSNTVSYAATTVSVKDGDYWLIFDQGGSMKCWIDGQPLFASSEPRYGVETIWIEHTFTAGDHTILVKVGNDGASADFRLSLVPANGRALPQRTARYAELLDDDQSLGIDPTLAGMVGEIRRDRNALEGYLWLSFMETVKGRTYDALRSASAAREVSGASDSAFADMLESDALFKQGRYNDGRNRLLRSAQRKVDFAPATKFALAELCGREQWEKVDALVKEAGDTHDGMLYAAWLALNRDGADQARAAVASFRLRFPSDLDLDLMLLDSDAYSVEEPASALLSRIRDHGMTTFADLRTLQSLRGADTAYELASTLSGLVPMRTDVWVTLLSSAWHAGILDPTTIGPMLDNVLSTFPYSAALIDFELDRAQTAYYAYESLRRSSTDLGAAAKQTLAGWIADEKSRYETALGKFIAHSPDEYELRNELRGLDGKAPYDRLLEGEDPDALIADYQQAAKHYESDAVIVARQSTLLFFGDGGGRSENRTIVHVLSDAGVRDWSSYQLARSANGNGIRVTDAYVRKPDGARTIAERAGDRLSFPGLQVGDFVVVQYAQDLAFFGPLRSEFWGDAIVNGYYPTYRSSARIIYPDSAEPDFAYHNCDELGIEETRGKFDAELDSISFNAHDIDAVAFESWMPDWEDTLAWIDVSSIGDWGRIVDWYIDMAEGQLIVTPAVQARADSLVVHEAGMPSAVDRAATIASIYEFVSAQIDYEDLSFMYSAYVPERPQDVLDDGFGDCKDQSALVVTLLRAAGIESHLALSAPDYAGDNFFLPSPRFSHVVVVVPDPDGDIILDPTTSDFTYPDLPPSMIGTWLLPIVPGNAGTAAELQRVPPPTIPQTTYYLLEVFPGPSRSTVKGTAVLTGLQAGVTRWLLESDSASQQRREFEAWVQASIPGFQLTALHVENRDTLNAEPMVEFTGSIPGPLVTIDAQLAALDIPWLVSLPAYWMNIGGEQDRAHDVQIDLDALDEARRQVTVIHLPNGAQIYRLPENLTYEGDGVTVRYQFSASTSALICERLIRIPRSTIPTDGISAFRELQATLFAKEREKVVLRLPGSR